MQTWALLVDSYRLLLSRKLFWITLALSGLVILLYASIGFNENGWYLFFGLTQIPDEFIRSGSEFAETFYLGIFSGLIVEWYFTWIAIILALVSTASVYTDMMAEGSIDLIVAKPLSRARIFLIKYVGSLLFVVVQIGLFSLGVFLCAGLRVDSWNWKIFLSIPIVVVFFSYLYCVHVLLSMLTRSTLASLLLTIVFWFGIAAVQWTEKVLASIKVTQQVAAEFVDNESAASPFGPPSPQPRIVTDEKADAKLTPEQRAKKKADELEKKKARQEARRKEHLERAENFETWQRRVGYVLAVLPKTQDTVQMLSKWMLGDKALVAQKARMSANNSSSAGRRNMGQEMQTRLQKEFVERSATYAIGTSLLFEAAVLGFGCFLFYRRDF